MKQVDRDQVCTLPVREKTDSATVCLKCELVSMIWPFLIISMNPLIHKY